MNILNIHGYNGSRDNTNYHILNDAGFRVFSYTISYDTTDPVLVEYLLADTILTHSIDLVVATSFGSFFGKIISNTCDVRFIATNPCFKPSIILRNIAPHYFTEVNEDCIAKGEKFIASCDWNNDVIFLGDQDEVIDHNITKSIARSATFYIVPGGHKLQRRSYEDKLIQEVKKHEKVNQGV